MNNNMKETKEKVCKTCHRVLPVDIEHFHRHKECKDGFRNKCKECRGSSFGIHQINKCKKPKDGYKFCGKCKTELPMTVEYFYNDKVSETKFSSWCKECHGRKYGVFHINVVNKNNIKSNHKLCSMCAEELPFEKFSKCKDNSDGYKSRCKICQKEAGGEYNSRPETKKRRSEYGKEYRKKYYATEKGKNVNKRNNQLRRSRKQDAIYNYSLDEWDKTLESFDYKCAYCGKRDSLQQEHIIPLSKGGYYTKQNIIPACQSCNGSKHNYNLVEWYPKKSFFSEERFKKIKEWANINNKSNTQQLTFL